MIKRNVLRSTKITAETSTNTTSVSDLPQGDVSEPIALRSYRPHNATSCAKFLKHVDNSLKFDKILNIFRCLLPET